ncbi:MAG TPA: penicillin-binding transpeptidase domain-containing protein, partial [bacterium]|nr:penicillin-binding transpeptidase domain-containing protein [bacterium]
LPEGMVLAGTTDEDIAKMKTSIKTDKIYQGLVKQIDTKSNTMQVQVGAHTGSIIARDFGWARKRNNAASGYDDVMYVKSPQSVAKEGDVIEVKVVDIDRLTDKQKAAYKTDALYFSLEETPKVEGALFCYDPMTGYVKAIFGGKDFANSEFNRATQALRQTGSVFKPLLYAAAIDKGYRPDTIINDEPLKIPDGPGRFWTPQNYGGGYRGPMTLHSALVASRNVVSVRILLDVGVDYVTAQLRKLGVTTKIDKVYSMALGANDMKLSEVTRAFGIFPTGGILPEYIFIKKMTDRYGNIVEQKQPAKIVPYAEQVEQGDLIKQTAVPNPTVRDEDALRKDLWTVAQHAVKRDQLMLTPSEEILLYGKHLPEGYVMNPKTMATMVGIMQDIVNFGTGYRVHELGRPVAGKTGTTNDLTDCWFVGYTPNLVAGVWTGYDQAINKVGGGETGGKAAAPIFLYFMKDYLKDTPVAQFPNPQDVQLSALEPAIDVMPGNVSDLFTDTNASGGADFFADDI